MNSDEVIKMADNGNSNEEKKDDWVEASSIAAAGIEHSKDGTFVTAPDALVDFEDLNASNPYDVPHKDPNMHYQIISKRELGWYISRFRAVPITRAEFDIPDELQKEYGQPNSSLHEVFDAVYIKMPKELYERRNEQKNRIARESMAALEMPQELIEKAKSDGFRVDSRYRNTAAEKARGE